MKIALVLPAPPGYSETFFTSKIKGLQASGHEVILVTAATSEKFDACKHMMHPKVYKSLLRQGLACMVVGVRLLAHVKQVMRYVRLEREVHTPIRRIIEKTYINATLLQLKTDWLHFGFATMAIERELVAKAIDAKLAVSFRGYDINVYPLKYPKVYDLLWQQVDKVHSISNDLLQKAYKLGLSKSIPYQIVTPAVNLGMLSGITPIDAPKGLRILTIARLHYIKGIDVLLETAAILNKRNIDFTWDIIGSGNNSEKERYLYQKYRLGLGHQVRFLGKRNHQETLSILQKANLYVQTSLTEGFCNALLEAQALGVLSLAFAKGGVPENIVDGKTGFLVNEISADVLANKIQEVLEKPLEVQQKMSEQAKQRVKNVFNLELQSRAFDKFYST